MAIAVLPDAEQLEMPLLDHPWPRPELDPWPRPQLRLMMAPLVEPLSDQFEGQGCPDSWHPDDPRVAAAAAAAAAAAVSAVAVGPDRDRLACAPRQGSRPGRSRPSAKVRRRRLGVAALAVAGAMVVLAGAGVLANPVRSVGGTPGAAEVAADRALTAGAAPATSLLPVSTAAGKGTFYVVRPGDTLGSIAARIDPADPRSGASRLAAELGSKVVVPGEHVPVP